MVIVIFLLLVIEILTLVVLREHLKPISRSGYIVSLVVHALLSLLLWFYLVKTIFYRGLYDLPSNVSDHMKLMGLVCGVVFPRFIFITIHYVGKLFRIRKGGHIIWFTRSAMACAALIMIVLVLSAFIGRFNFTTEEVTINFKDLPSGLNGLRIAQVSDMHLASFYGHAGKMEKVIEKVNAFNPDLIINTGDFISFGWREFGRFDTLLVKARSRLGKFAILGNHDAGTYLPRATLADKQEIISETGRLISLSGYHLLKDEHFMTVINGVKVAFIGLTTGGRHPHITFGDLRKAVSGIDSADFKILLAHDPNQWEKEVTEKTDIDLTLSGHTHGMQMGIITRKLRWSPVKIFYPHWNGLYRHGEQAQYVNRGLGVLAIPFRIWMPPEITLITLVRDR